MADRLAARFKKQPNLVFAAARYNGIDPGPFETFRSALISNWERIRGTVLARRTQTNEVGRLATLLPVFAALPQPLALLEVGASAGLRLYPDKYSYDYGNGHLLAPAAGPGAAVLHCAITGPVPLPTSLPQVAWRAGIDLNPLNVANDDDVRWLNTLIWPGQDARRRQFAAAISVTRSDPPLLVTGDLNETVGHLADQAPPDATLVIFHSAVLVYLTVEARKQFVSTVKELPATGSPTRLPPSRSSQVRCNPRRPTPTNPSSSFATIPPHSPTPARTANPLIGSDRPQLGSGSSKSDETVKHPS